jgi:hypothetical protein
VAAPEGDQIRLIVVFVTKYVDRSVAAAVAHSVATLNTSIALNGALCVACAACAAAAEWVAEARAVVRKAIKSKGHAASLTNTTWLGMVGLCSIMTTNGA